MKYLENCPILEQNVGYGSLGLHGDMGYEGLYVQVHRSSYLRALSVHAPSRLVFELGGNYASFHCQVALNDDVVGQSTSADFSVFADGRLLTREREVMPGQLPRDIHVNVVGVQRLELVTATRHWAYCHTVWLDPYVDTEPLISQVITLVDCLERAEVQLPDPPIRAHRCIATVVTPGYTEMLDAMLGSLHANGQCQGAAVVVFAVDPDAECRRIVAKYEAHLIPCRAFAPTTCAVKAILYSVARVIDAQQFLCLDADTLVLEDLNPLFAALDACTEGSMLVASDAHLKRDASTLGECLCNYYGGRVE